VTFRVSRAILVVLAAGLFRFGDQKRAPNE
jgi:hypothetical protein